MKIYVTTDDKKIKQVVLDEDEVLSLTWALQRAKNAACANRLNSTDKFSAELWKAVAKDIDRIKGKLFNESEDGEDCEASKRK